MKIKCEDAILMKCNEHSRLHKITNHEAFASYLPLIKALQHKLTYIKRTCEIQDSWYEPLRELLFNLTLSDMMYYQVGSEHIEKIISMPRKHGGLNIVDPCRGAAQEYNYSLSVSEPAMQEIVGMEAAKMQDRIRQEIKADKQNRIHQVRDDLKSASDELLTIIENASRIGSLA
ncbi:hypothetical protein GJ496_002811 [Pomphorhynchus laevis]|nr:hypothetical protein GJ496_002811 [Pomphorhynchus laevis]